VSGVPVQYVIGPAGKIVKSFLGYGLLMTDLADVLTEMVGAARPAFFDRPA
jgi:hypothetical protein